MSRSGGGLFDERRDSNPSLGAFVFSPAVALADLRSGLEVLRTMVEREMQELLWLYPERFLNKPLKQFAWEESSDIGRADLVFEDRHGRLITGAYHPVDLRFRTLSHLRCRHRRILWTSGMTDLTRVITQSKMPRTQSKGSRRSALGGNRCGVWLCATSSLAGILCRQSSVQNEHGCGKKNRHSSCESLTGNPKRATRRVTKGS
jgi:hypothetical protein